MLGHTRSPPYPLPQHRLGVDLIHLAATGLAQPSPKPGAKVALEVVERVARYFGDLLIGEVAPGTAQQIDLQIGEGAIALGLQGGIGSGDRLVKVHRAVC